MITLDFETYYTKAEYSLSKMTYEEYVRDPRFEVIGLSVMIDDGPVEWYTGDAAGISLWLRTFDWNQAVCSHNALFDMAILCWKFGVYPAVMCDTLAMARKLHGLEGSCSLAAMAKLYGLPEKGGYVANADGMRREDFTAQMLVDYGEYCKHDTWLCRQLYKAMRPYFPVEELQAIDWTTQIFARPTLRVDVPLAEQALREHIQQRDTALANLGVTIEALRSDQVVADMLISLGVDPPTKESPKQKNADGSPKELWAFAKSDVAFLDLAEHPDPRVAAIIDARLSAKTSIVETRLGAFAAIGRRGSMPYPLGYAAALPTDRWQAALGQQINLQNLPRAPKGGRSPLRDAIKPPPGHLLGVVDLSQIEMRVALWLSGQDDALDMLRHGQDLYCAMAADIYGYAVVKAQHPMERFVGKVACLSAQYGVGGPKFARMLQVAARREGLVLADESEDFGLRVVQAYRRKNPQIVQFWRMCEQALEIMAAGGNGMLGPLRIENGAIAMPDGMWLRYPNLRRYTSDEGKSGWVYDKWDGKSRRMRPKWVYGGLVFENLCQRIARGIMRDGILQLRKHVWVAGSVHDEAIYLPPDTCDVKPTEALAVQCMTNHPFVAMGLPLAAEGSIGKSYGEAK